MYPAFCLDQNAAAVRGTKAILKTALYTHQCLSHLLHGMDWMSEMILMHALHVVDAHQANVGDESWRNFLDLAELLEVGL